MEEGIKDILEFDPSNREDYYGILGCDELSSKEQIIAEYRARVLNCHPDKHPDNPEAAKQFELLQSARDVLTDDKKRQNYDKWRHAGVAIPYKTWAGMRETVHTLTSLDLLWTLYLCSEAVVLSIMGGCHPWSMHWASPKKEYMIEETAGHSRLQPQTPSSCVIMQNRHPSEDFGVMRTGADAVQRNVPWTRDTASEMLRKFRNYEI